jgi:predicted flap endonuclease-1-like 5' DNA nuclease
MWPYTENFMSGVWSNTNPVINPMLAAHRDKIDAWESLVKQVLATQTEWSDTMSARVSDLPGLPHGVTGIADQMHSLTGNMIRFQTQLWDGWFALLKGVETTAEAPKAENVVPRVAKTPARTTAKVVKPTQPKPKVVVATTQETLALPLDELDDLKAISGVGPALERKLNDFGVKTYRQMAAWTKKDIGKIEEQVMAGRFAGRIVRDDWVGQAKAMHQDKYGQKA